MDAVRRSLRKLFLLSYHGERADQVAAALSPYCEMAAVLGGGQVQGIPPELRPATVDFTCED